MKISDGAGPPNHDRFAFRTDCGLCLTRADNDTGMVLSQEAGFADGDGSGSVGQQAVSKSRSFVRDHHDRQAGKTTIHLA